jgi:hypothetical protein
VTDPKIRTSRKALKATPWDGTTRYSTLSLMSSTVNKPIRARFRIPRRKTTSQKTMTKDNCHQKNNNNNKRTSKIRENTSDLDRQTSINAA